MTDKPHERNEILQIAQQVSDTQRNALKRQQQADLARRSPPPIMKGQTDCTTRQMG